MLAREMNEQPRRGLFRIEVRFNVEMDPGELLDEHVEAVLVALEELEDVVQADATASESEGWVDLDVAIATDEGTTVPTRIDNAFTILRTGLHAAGAGTPDWPDHNDLIAQWRMAGLRGGDLVDA